MAPMKSLCPVCGKEICPICGWAVPSEYRTITQYRHAYTPNAYHEDDAMGVAAIREFQKAVGTAPDCSHTGDVKEKL